MTAGKCEEREHIYWYEEMKKPDKTRVNYYKNFGFDVELKVVLVTIKENIIIAKKTKLLIVQAIG